MDKLVTIIKEHTGLLGNRGNEIFWSHKLTPEGYKFIDEFCFKGRDSHIHVGLYEFIPLPPPPTIEEAAIAWFKADMYKQSKASMDLTQAVQRKLNEDD